MHRFLPALQAQGGKVQSLPVRHRERVAGVSKYGFFDRLWVGISDIIGVMWLVRRSRLPSPLQIYGNAVSETLSPLEVAFHPHAEAVMYRKSANMPPGACRGSIPAGRLGRSISLASPHLTPGVARGAH